MTIPDPVRELLEGSGNTFHARVARWLQQNGWATTISPFYMDPTQNKAREIDLVAERVWHVKDPHGRDTEDVVVVRLLLECKYLAAHSVFWFAEKDKRAAESLVCASGLFRQGNTYTAKHHYLAGSTRVAKLFASNNARAAENEPFYKALNQVLNASNAMRGQPLFSTGLVQHRGGARHLLEFPVVVCSSFDLMYEVGFFDEGEPCQASDNFQLEVIFAYIDPAGAPKSTYTLVDVVAFDNLESFVSVIDQDARTAAFFAQRH